MILKVVLMDEYLQLFLEFLHPVNFILKQFPHDSTNSQIKNEYNCIQQDYH